MPGRSHAHRGSRAPGTFPDLEGDFVEDPSDPGTFDIVAPIVVPAHRKWVEGEAETTPTVERLWGWVTAYDIPLTAADGEMRVCSQDRHQPPQHPRSVAARDRPGPKVADDTALVATGTVYEVDAAGGRVRVGLRDGDVWLPAIAGRYVAS